MASNVGCNLWLILCCCCFFARDNSSWSGDVTEGQFKKCEILESKMGQCFQPFQAVFTVQNRSKGIYPISGSCTKKLFHQLYNRLADKNKYAVS